MRRVMKILALPLFAATAPDVAAIDIVSFHELPQERFRPVHPSSIARDGTIVGISFAEGNEVVRWRPGQPPEGLGGGPGVSTINITPAISLDGTTIVRPKTDFETIETTAMRWRDDSGWQAIDGAFLAISVPVGISEDGSHVVGYGLRDVLDPHFQPWVWSEDGGQRLLPVPVDRPSGEAWAISSDGRIVAGHVYYEENSGVNWPVTWRFACRWVDGVLEPLLDAEGWPLGQAVACNSDCSVIVGGGYGGDSLDRPAVGRAWYWTEATGGVYLDVASLPAGARAPHHAMAVSEDGRVIVGTYTMHVPGPLGTIIQHSKPFLWHADTGMHDLTTLMAEHGIVFGGDGWELVPSAITPDGKRIVLNGMDPEPAVRSGVLVVDDGAAAPLARPGADRDRIGAPSQRPRRGPPRPRR